MRLSKHPIIFLLALFFGVLSTQAQTVIFSNSGTSYTNTDAVTTNNYGPVDVSNCSSISYSLQYNFSLPFPGSGNMESSDECNFGLGCPGDPNDPSGGSCSNCWDFLYVQFQLDGVTVHTELVGVPGSLAPSGTLAFGPVCTNGAANAGIIVQTQTWAGNETITFSNITITCWDASATLSANPNPVCSGLPFNLSSILTDPGAVMSTLWTGPGAITTPTNLNTSVTGAPVGTNTYTFTATDDNACTNSSTIDVTVNQGPTLDDPPNITVCAGEPVDVAFTGTVNPDFNWTNTNPAIGLGPNGMGDISFTAANVFATTTGNITVTPTEAGCTGPSQSFTITVTPVPTVNQPNDVNVCAGANVVTNFTGTAGATFDWTNDNPAIGLGAAGSGNLNFVSANVAAQEQGNITVTPTINGCPGNPITFSIVVNPAPTVDDPPNLTVCAGEQVDVLFSGTVNPNFNWTNTNPAIGLGPNGMGDISFTAATVFAPTTGTITVTPSEAGCPGPSQSFTITVTPVPTVNQPNDVSVCAGANVVTNFTGTAGATFDWTNDNPAIGLGAAGSGNLNFVSANVAMQEQGDITVTPSINGCPGNPITFSIVINPAPTVDDPPNQTVCAGEQVDVIFSGTGSPNFNWTNTNPAIGLGPNGTGDISFTAATVFAPTTGTITVTPSESGCNGPSQSFTITVTPVPTVNQPNDVSVCAGANVITNFTGTAGATFDWTNDNPAIGLGAAGSGNLNFVSAIVSMQEQATITVTPTINGCPGNPITFSIVINPAPSVDDPLDQTVCAGAQVDVVFTGTGSPNFNWTNNNPLIGLGPNGTGDISFTAANVFAPATGTINITPSESGCNGPSQSFTITVTPVPTVNQPNDVTVCAGANVVTNFTGTAGASFDWTNDNPAIGLGATGSGNLNFVSANVTSQEQATLTVTPSVNGCPGNPITFTIIVNPAPSLDDPLDLTVCAEELVDVIFTGTGSPNYSWTNTNPLIGLATIGAGDISFTAANVVAPATGTITVTPMEAGCSGPTQSFTITVRPVPSLNQPSNESVCPGENVVTIFTSTPGSTVTWTNSNPAIGLPTAGVGNINFTAANVSVTTTGNISVTPTLGGCLGATLNFDITIDPPPTINITAVACAGDLLTYSIELSSNGTNITSSAGNVTGSGGIFSINDIPAGENVTIISTNTATGCQSQQSVNAPNCSCPPVLPVNNPNSPVICEGEPIPSLTVSSSVGTTVDWYAAPTGGTPLLVGSNSYTPIGILTPGMYSFFAEARDTSTDCTSATRLEVILTINMVPAVMQPMDQTVCAGTTIAINFMGTGAAVLNWTNSNANIGLAASGTGDINFGTTNSGSTPLVANLVVTPSLNGCTGTAQNFNITVNPIPSVTAPANLSQCSDSPVLINFSGTNGATFDWTNDNPAIGLGASGMGDISFTAASVMTSTVANISITPSLSGCFGPVQNFSITINPVPGVNAPADQSVCVGTNVALNFTGTSAAVFNWTNTNPAIGLGASGVGDIDFMSTNVGNTPLVGNLVVTPSLNGCTGTAQNFTISVNPLPSLTVDSTNCSSDLSTYTIFVNTNANTLISSVGTVSGTGPVFSISAIPAGTNALLTVTNTATNCTQQQTVNAPNCNCAPVPAATQPNNPVICEGAAIPALTVVTTAGITVDWYDSASGGMLLLMGNNSFTPTGILTPGIYRFYAEAREIATDCKSATRIEVTLTVNALPGVMQPMDQSVCVGTGVTLNFTGTGGAVFNWTNSNPAIGLGASGVGNVNFTSTNTGNTLMVGNLVVTPNLNGCTGTAQNFTITVNPLPSLTIDSTNCSSDLSTYTIFVNSNANTLISSVGTVSGTGSVFNISAIPAGTNALLTVTNTATNCTQQQTVNAPNCNCAPVPAASQPNNPVICEGAAIPALTVATAAGITVDWYDSATGGMLLLMGNNSFTPPGMLTTGVYRFYAEARETTTSCTSTTRIEVTLTVNPLPSVMQPLDQSVCVGTGVTLNFTGTSGAVFNWTNSNPAIGVGANGMGNISFLSTNTGNTPLVGNLVVIPSLNGCSGTVQNFSITVNPLPSLTIDSTNCSSDLSTYTIFVNTNANTLISSVGTVSGTGPVFNVAAIPASESALLTVTNTTTSCTQQLTVNPPNCNCAPVPAATQPNNPVICEGAAIPALTVVTTAGITVDWYDSASGGTLLLMENNSFTPPGILNPGVYRFYAEARETGTDCTSTARIEVILTVNQSSASTVQMFTCDTAQVGTTTTILTNAAGCDSILTTITTLDLANCVPAPILSNGMVTCFGNTDGILNLSAINGLSPYQFNWSNGAQSGSGSIPNSGNSVQIPGLAAGTYTVTITGANGLTSTISAEVSSPALLTAQATAALVFGQYALSCNGATDASIQASATGGSPQYQYTWNVSAEDSAMLTGVGAGTYSVTVTDARQCTASSSVTIENPPALRFELLLDEVACGENFTTALITPLNGSEPFSVNLDGLPVSGGLMPSISAGNHLLEIQDANGCTADTMLLVDLPAVPLITLPSEVSVSPGETVVLEAQTNLSSWQSLVWTPTPDTTCTQCLLQVWIPENSGQYVVVITDDAGCSASASVRVLVKNQVDIYVPNVFSPNGDGLNDFWTVQTGVQGLSLHSLYIFDRWGDQLYGLEEPIPVNEWSGWDGSFRGDPVNPGVFVYFLEVQLPNGEIVLKKGDMTVVR
jgi:gliding motility-associated-like protein